MSGHVPGPVRPSAPRRWTVGMLAVVMLVVGALVGVGASPASAIRPATLDGFSAGNLMSDAVFTNSTTMTEDAIQTFLNGKVPACQSGYTCLKDFRQNTVSRSADNYCAGYSGAAGESAARIIAKSAQSCGINPQVLLVMLQKEQGLITHTWPSSWRYDAALGQGCPDDAACNPDYVGFFFQIYGAARQMKIYMEGRYFTWYAPGNTWNILYNPNQGCGSSPVYIANKATAALYYYTPYQPNAAALRAGYGEGDSCSAYGNRNFYNYFTDWFGSTQSNPGSDNPFGNVELVQAAPGSFTVSGWAIDPNTSDPLSVHVYVGSTGQAFTSNLSRPDVGAAYPGAGNAHGFSAVVPATGAGDANVCVYAINQGPGANVLLGCRTATIIAGSIDQGRVPFGNVEAVTAASGTITAAGWVIDPDTADPISVHIYVDAAGVAYTAGAARPDVGAAYPASGANHGFAETVAASAGNHNVCVYAINNGAGGNVLLGCTTVTVPGSPSPAPADQGRVPFGNVEAVTADAGAVSVSGWTIDPDTADPISVHIYVDASGVAYTAGVARPDVGAAYPASGVNHGFGERIPSASGTHDVCVYAINNGAGGNVLLGCTTVTVP